MWKTSFGHCIHTSPSGIKVWQNLFYRWLTFKDGEIIQTIIHRKKPQKPAVPYLIPLCALVSTQPGDTCLLGLGGGAVGHYLDKELQGYLLTTVDNNEEMIDIAKKYFSISSLNTLKIVHQNANNYVQDCSHLYQHILIDLYHSYSFPKECDTQKFFTHCAECLDKNGFLAINLANPEEQPSLYKKTKPCFKSCLNIPIPQSSNLVILASKSHTMSELIARFEQKCKVRKVEWDSVWGCTAWI